MVLPVAWHQIHSGGIGIVIGFHQFSPKMLLSLFCFFIYFNRDLTAITMRYGTRYEHGFGTYNAYSRHDHNQCGTKPCACIIQCGCWYTHHLRNPIVCCRHRPELRVVWLPKYSQLGCLPHLSHTFLFPCFRGSWFFSTRDTTMLVTNIAITFTNVSFKWEIPPSSSD